MRSLRIPPITTRQRTSSPATRIVPDTVAEAVEKQKANATMIFVPALFCRDAILEAVALAGEKLLSAATWEENIREILGGLGQATGVSHAL